MKNFIWALPKAELHVHLEGTLEPELLLLLAQRNKIKLPSDLPEFYKFNNLTDFLYNFNRAVRAICTGQDFYDITYAYLKKAAQQGVVHTEIAFDTQNYIARNISSHEIIDGIKQALITGQKEFGISSLLILSFLRNLSERSAFESLESVLFEKEKIVAVGLACSEIGNDARKFIHIFALAKKLGYKRTAHTGEESGPQAIWQALNLLDLNRIDHGIRCIEDSTLVAELARRQIPLTVCPLSNLALNIYPEIARYPLLDLLEKNILLSVNSDDPAYFGGYIADNYLLLAEQLGATREQLVKIARNSIISSFLDYDSKQEYIIKLDNFVKANL